MHIKITRTIPDSDERWEINERYTKCKLSVEEFIVSINSVSLSKVMISCHEDNIYQKYMYQVHIQDHKNIYGGHAASSIMKTILVSKEEYNRIEHLLAFNNKKDLEIISNSYPELNVKNAIKDLQLNED